MGKAIEDKTVIWGLYTVEDNHKAFKYIRKYHPNIRWNAGQYLEEWEPNAGHSALIIEAHGGYKLSVSKHSNLSELGNIRERYLKEGYKLYHIRQLVNPNDN